MAVALDANASAEVNATARLGTTGLTSTNLTVGAGANRALIVQIAFSVKAVTSIVVTWDSGGSNQDVPLIVSQQNTAAGVNGGLVGLWGLANPISGAKTLKVVWNAVTSDIYLNHTAFTGVDQTGGATSFPHSTSQTGSFGAVTLAITSAVGNWTVSHIVEDLGSISLNTQTLAYIDNALAIGAGAEHATGAASVTHGFTVGTGGAVYAWVGTDIAVASGVVVGNLAWITA